ncbi:MAG: MazG nucleotide pyrophosphohydrolase domain-containing protein [Planctomycetota bacterium]
MTAKPATAAPPADAATLADAPPTAAPTAAAPAYRYTKLAVSGADFEALRDLIDTLLSEPGGCPWDKAQSLQSLLQLFPMEVAEVREAAQNGDREAVFDELGDCFMLLLLLLAKAQNLPAAVAPETAPSTVTASPTYQAAAALLVGAETEPPVPAAQAAAAPADATWEARKALDLVCEKIVRRHTWIFGADQAASPAEVEKLWEQNKQREKMSAPPNASAGLAGSGAPASSSAPRGSAAPPGDAGA